MIPSRNILLVSFYCLFIVSGAAFSQQKEKLYLNENNEEIDFSHFRKKLGSDIYLSETLISKEKEIYRLQLAEFIGVLEERKRNQLFQLLAQRANVDTSKTMFIRYRDTLLPAEELKQRKRKIGLSNGHSSYTNDYEQMVKSSKSWSRLSKSGKHKSYNFYTHNLNVDDSFDGVNWQKDPLAIIHKMFDTFDNQFGFFLVIHPDGKFWLRNGCLVNDLLGQMPNYKVWDKFHSDFQKEYLSLNKVSATNR